MQPSKSNADAQRLEDNLIMEEIKSANEKSNGSRREGMESFEEITEDDSKHGIGEIEAARVSSGSAKNDEYSDVYVAVGLKDQHVIKWVLKNMVNAGASLTLIHIYPELHSIKTPMGKLPKSRASPECYKKHIYEEESKRRILLQKYTQICSAAQVRTDNVMIENDSIVKTLLELIPILTITRLVVGSSRKGKARPGSIAASLQEKAPACCDIIVVDKYGKRVTCVDNAASPSNSHSVSPSPSTSKDSSPSFVIGKPGKHPSCLPCSCIK